jgi:hypothetical protein
MTYIVLIILNEIKPMRYYILAAALFVLSQLDFFLLNKVICKVNEGVLPAFLCIFSFISLHFLHDSSLFTSLVLFPRVRRC